MTLRRDRKRGQKRTPGKSSWIGKGCMHCGHPGAHFVPPSFGDPGFFACDSFCTECRAAAIVSEPSTPEQPEGENRG